MPDAGIARRVDRDLGRDKIDIAKLRGFRRARMRNADQMRKRVRASNMLCVGIHLQGIADYA